MSTKPKPFVFTLMPFDKEFDDIYALGIKAAADEAGAYAERVDEQIFHESILTRIYNQISKADLVVADMTGRNPNVFYEVGYAHALGKPVFLLTQMANDIPFDLKHFPHVVYGGRITELKTALRQRIKWSIENPSGVARNASSDIKLHVNGKVLTTDGTVIPFDANQYVGLTIDVQNSSELVYDSSQLQLSVVTPSTVHSPKSAATSVTLPDGNLLHVFPELPRLFPGAWHSQTMQFVDDFSTDSFVVDFVVRVFTEFGTQDYPVTLEGASGST